MKRSDIELNLVHVKGKLWLEAVPTFRARPLKADIPARKLTSDNDFSTLLGQLGVVLSGRIGGLGCDGNRSERSPFG